MRAIPNDYDLRRLTKCAVTEGGTTVHVHGGTVDTWRRCQCGAREADIVDGQLVLRRIDN